MKDLASFYHQDVHILDSDRCLVKPVWNTRQVSPIISQEREFSVPGAKRCDDLSDKSLVIEAAAVRNLVFG